MLAPNRTYQKSKSLFSRCGLRRIHSKRQSMGGPMTMNTFSLMVLHSRMGFLIMAISSRGMLRTLFLDITLCAGKESNDVSVGTAMDFRQKWRAKNNWVFQEEPQSRSTEFKVLTTTAKNLFSNTPTSGKRSSAGKHAGLTSKTTTKLWTFHTWNRSCGLSNNCGKKD